MDPAAAASAATTATTIATDPSLAEATRAAITLTTLAFVVVAGRALAGARAAPRLALGLGAAFLVAAAFTHVPLLRDTQTFTFPIGFGLAVLAAAASLAWPAARRAFDAASDRDVRLMLGFRAVYGGLLLAMAGTGQMPVSFALTAGLGDLLVGWLAAAAPTSLAAGGPRPWRVVVHGTGMLDILQVLFLAVTFVRPWSLAHGNAMSSVTLPWLAVPLMFALNAHGLRQAWYARNSQPERHGSESVGGLRGVLSRT